MPEMFFFAAEENVFSGRNLAGMSVCGDGQRALQHIDEDMAVERRWCRNPPGLTRLPQE